MKVSTKVSHPRHAMLSGAIAPRMAGTGMAGTVRLIALMGLVAVFPDFAEAADLGKGGKAPSYGAPPTYEAPSYLDKLHEWKVVVGGGAIYKPVFEGSDEFEVLPFPLFSATFGERVRIDPRGIVVDVYNTNGLTFGVKGGYDLGRDEDDSDDLRGLGDIDAGGVIGGTVSYGLGPVKLYGEVNKTVGGSDGLTATMGADVSHVYQRFLFSVGASATWADDNHMQSFFGVNAVQSQNSGLAEFDAEAGFKRFDITASVTYAFTEKWFVRGQAGVGFLAGDAADSPIVQDEVQPSALVGVGYRF